MRLVKALGTALVAVVAFSAMTVVGASAHVFEASLSSGTVTVKGDGLQTFTTPAGKLFCSGVSGTGGFNQAKTEHLLVLITYDLCFTSITGATVDVPIVVDLLKNSDGSIDILAPIVIKFLATGLKCAVTVSPQNSLKTLTFDNLAGGSGILELANVEGISSSATGSLCSYATSKTGKYTGNTIAQVVGGELKWV